MAGFSDTYENLVLNHVHKGTAMTQPPGLFLALSIADPGETGAGLSEPAGGAYARVDTSTGVWTAASGGQVKNNTQINFAQATGNWGLISHVALMTAVTGGTMIWYGPLAVAKTVTNSDQFSFLVNNLVVSLD